MAQQAVLQVNKFHLVPEIFVLDMDQLNLALKMLLPVRQTKWEQTGHQLLHLRLSKQQAVKQELQQLKHLQHAKIVLTVVVTVKTAEDRTTNVNVAPSSDLSRSAIWYAVLSWQHFFLLQYLHSLGISVSLLYNSYFGISISLLPIRQHEPQ